MCGHLLCVCVDLDLVLVLLKYKAECLLKPTGKRQEEEEEFHVSFFAGALWEIWRNVTVHFNERKKQSTVCLSRGCFIKGLASKSLRDSDDGLTNPTMSTYLCLNLKREKKKENTKILGV